MSDKHVAMRSCIICISKSPKRDLVRIVSSSTDGILIDKTGKYSGRGAYLCKNAKCWDLAQNGAKLSKALRMELSMEMLAQLTEYSSMIQEGNSVEV